MTTAGERTILIIDDDAAARRMMRRALERRGFAIAEASDGTSGLSAIREVCPDLVLLDLRMPGELSGLDVVTAVRADVHLHAIPLIVVSASAHDAMRAQTLQAGCAAFVEKPVDFIELERTIAQALR